MAKEDWYSASTRVHTTKLREKILKSSAARTGAFDPNVSKLRDELKTEKRNVESWHRYGGQQHQKSKEEALRRALTYAHDSLEIGKETGNMELVYDSLEVLAEIDPRYIAGEEGNKSFSDYANWIAEEIDSAYKKGERAAPSISGGYMKKIEGLVKRLKEESENKYVQQQRKFNILHGRRNVHAASIAGFIAGSVLLLDGITGYTISGMSQKSSNTIGLVLFLLGLVGMILASKNSGK